MSIQFIDNASIDKNTRRLIRSHVAKGKNLGRTIHRPSRHPRKARVTASEDTAPELRPEADNSIESAVSLTIQRQLQEELSSSLPFDTSPTCRRLFCHCWFYPGRLFSFMLRTNQTEVATFMRLEPYTPELRKTVIKIDGPRLFLQYAFFDEAFFHCVVAMSVAASIPFTATRQETTEAFSHLSRGIQLVNQRLAENRDSALSGTTLAVVILMAQHERLLGYYDHALVHFEGLHKIVALRGGISTVVSECPGVAQKALQADFDFALHLGSSTRFSPKCIPGKAALGWLREKYWETRTESHHAPVFAISEKEGFREVFEDMCVLAWLVNDNTVHGITVNDYDFHNILLLIGYRLLNVQPLNTPIEDRDKLELLLHLGLAALMAKFFFTMGMKPPDVDLLYRYIVSAALKHQYTSRDEQERLLWLLFTGKSTLLINVDDDIWLIPEISRVTAQLGISTWDQVSRILQKFPWVRTFSNESAQTLWNQTCSLDLLKRPSS
ncbi:hypothetical protein F5Y03DRAFT_163162 [Xylaria venustula]|nr:hypothetical protein F5Y03DRAFT_163162 [Xylaria venustula]